MIQAVPNGSGKEWPSIQMRKGCEDLVAAAHRLARVTDARRVYVFGSVAAGKTRDFGDIDLCYVVPDGVDLLSVQKKAQSAFVDRLTPMDLVGMTEGAFDSGLHLLAREIKRNGKLLYIRHES